MRFLMIVLTVLCALAWLGAASPAPKPAGVFEVKEATSGSISDALRRKRAASPDQLDSLSGATFG